MVVGPGRRITHHFGDWSGIIERPALESPYTVHSDPDCPCAYIYVKDVVQSLVDLKRANASRLRSRMYNIYEMDTMAAFDDFGFVLRYLLDPMIADFIADVRAGRTGSPSCRGES